MVERLFVKNLEAVQGDDPPEHVASWRVIVDGARTGRVLLDAISSEGELAATSICILAELHEREAAFEIQKHKVSVWYLEDQHIEVPPLQAVRPNEHDDALVNSSQQIDLMPSCSARVS